METAKANALSTELVENRKVDKKTHAETWTLYNQQSETTAWWDYICHVIDVSKELDANIDFPNIPLMFY